MCTFSTTFTKTYNTNGDLILYDEIYGQPPMNIRIKDIKRDSTSSYAGQEQGELDMPRSPERRRCRVSPDLNELGNLNNDDHHWPSVMIISTSSNRKLPPPIEASRAGKWPSGD